MIGVVLWNDTSKNAAVIWCEDHGDLAFYYGDPTHDISLHSGDCVRFKVELEGSLRHAKDLFLVEGETHPALAASLANMDLSAELANNGAPEALEPASLTNPVAVKLTPGNQHGEKTAELVLFANHLRSKRQNSARRSAGACRVVRMS